MVSGVRADSCRSKNTANSQHLEMLSHVLCGLMLTATAARKIIREQDDAIAYLTLASLTVLAMLAEVVISAARNRVGSQIYSLSTVVSR